jgi:hypothetical protein
MSLTDALLLEPYRDPQEVWIALRADGAKGSGTQQDPWNGAPRYESSLSVTSLQRTADATGREAVATTATNHGYNLWDIVTISGVTGTGAQYL